MCSRMLTTEQCIEFYINSILQYHMDTYFTLRHALHTAIFAESKQRETPLVNLAKRLRGHISK